MIWRLFGTAARYLSKERIDIPCENDDIKKSEMITEEVLVFLGLFLNIGEH